MEVDEIFIVIFGEFHIVVESYIFLKKEKKKNYVIAEVPNQTHNEIDFVYEMNPSFENRSHISKCL